MTWAVTKRQFATSRDAPEKSSEISPPRVRKESSAVTLWLLAASSQTTRKWIVSPGERPARVATCSVLSTVDPTVVV